MNRIRDSLYGLAIGDAIGVPIETEHRSKLLLSPVTKMLGYGNHDVDKGTWSDDTALTLATMDSISSTEKLDYTDMAERFCEWINNAKYTATNEIFGIGTTTKEALMRFWNDKIDAVKCGGKGVGENGNGSLMRMMPIAFYCYYKELDNISIYEIVSRSSSITHAHEISIMGCYIYVKYLIYILNGNDKKTSLKYIKKQEYPWFNEETKKEYSRILNDNIETLDIEDISSSGYIVYTLESVLWTILNTNSFNQAIIGAINLGEDTDTIGAITGSIAGILYGYDSINEEWINTLKNKEYLDYMSRKFTNKMETI